WRPGGSVNRSAALASIFFSSPCIWRTLWVQIRSGASRGKTGWGKTLKRRDAETLKSEASSAQEEESGHIPAPSGGFRHLPTTCGRMLVLDVSVRKNLDLKGS